VASCHFYLFLYFTPFYISLIYDVFFLIKIYRSLIHVAPRACREHPAKRGRAVRLKPPKREGEEKEWNGSNVTQNRSFPGSIPWKS